MSEADGHSENLETFFFILILDFNETSTTAASHVQNQFC